MQHISREHSVGNRIIDTEHKKWHDTIEEIVHFLVAKDNAALIEAFEVLENCLCNYFVVEEGIAQALNFDFTKHRLSHQHLQNEYQRIKNELIAKNGAWSKHDEKCHIDMIMSRFIHHIKEDSMPLKVVLDTQYYDFKAE